MPHYPDHLVMGAAAFLAALIVQAITANSLIRRKLRLSTFLFGAYLLVNALLAIVSAGALNITDEDLRAVERLALAAGLINMVVISLINPLWSDRVPERFPTIVQDFIVIGFVVLAGTVLSEKLIATSAVSAVVVGFALQDTLGNAFAGLAIQSEAPFHVGNWIRVGGFEGRVTEITWRATKLRTKTGNFIIVPNNKIAEDAIVNYTEPAVPTRLELEVGASYLSPPNQVCQVIAEAIRQVRGVLESPPPDALLLAFDDSAITYRARFWILDYEFDDEIKDEVRTAIYYAFSRHGIEIPWPIEITYARPWPPDDPSTTLEAREAVVSSVDLFAGLDDAQRKEIAGRAAVRTFGNGEAIVREGQPGRSMFMVCSGRVGVVIGKEAHEVATIEAGGYFGEMSLLTGDPRTATVVARGDVRVLEVDAGSFSLLAAASPPSMERVAAVVASRRAELEQARSAAAPGVAVDTPTTLLARMRRFLRFG